MVEAGVLPVAGVGVAAAAGALPMVGRRLVALRAVRAADDAMVEAGRFPGAGAVAQAALALVVVGRLGGGVAALAIHGADRFMVEGGGLPGAGAVTGSALARKMACGTVALMTLRTA